MSNYLQEGNSGANQTIKGKLIEREVFCNVSTEVEYILRKAYEDTNAPYSYDDVENFYIDNSDEIAELEGKQDELVLLCTDESNDMDCGCDYCMRYQSLQSQIDDLEVEEEEEQQEWYEAWKVSTWFADRLKARGEMILDGDIWLRGTCGQAILLDYVVTQIAHDMEILDGMKNSKFWRA